MANDRKTFALYVHTGLEEDQHFKLDIPLDATLDDLKKIINDKRNIPQDNLYTLFHFRSNDEIDEENGTSKVTDLLKINEADQEYHIDLSHDCAAPVAVMIRGNGNNYWPPESSPCNFFIITGHQKQNNFEYAEVTHNFSQYCITSVSSFRFWSPYPLKLDTIEHIEENSGIIGKRYVARRFVIPHDGQITIDFTIQHVIIEKEGVGKTLMVNLRNWANENHSHLNGEYTLSNYRKEEIKDPKHCQWSSHGLKSSIQFLGGKWRIGSITNDFGSSFSINDFGLKSDDDVDCPSKVINWVFWNPHENDWVPSTSVEGGTIVNNVEVNIADRKNPKRTIIPFEKGIMKAYRERINDRSCPGGPGGLLRPSPHPAFGVGGAILGAAFKM